MKVEMIPRCSGHGLRRLARPCDIVRAGRAKRRRAAHGFRRASAPTTPWIALYLRAAPQANDFPGGTHRDVHARGHEDGEGRRHPAHALPPPVRLLGPHPGRQLLHAAAHLQHHQLRPAHGPLRQDVRGAVPLPGRPWHLHLLAVPPPQARGAGRGGPGAGDVALHAGQGEGALRALPQGVLRRGARRTAPGRRSGVARC